MSKNSDPKKFEDQTIMMSIVSKGDGETFPEYHIIVSLEGMGVPPVSKSVPWDDIPDALESLKAELLDAFMKFQAEAASKVSKKTKKKPKKAAAVKLVVPPVAAEAGDNDKKEVGDQANDAADADVKEEKTAAEVESNNSDEPEDGEKTETGPEESAESQDNDPQQMSIFQEIEL